MGDVWNRFGEKIGTTSGASYVDTSQTATDYHGGGENAKGEWTAGVGKSGNSGTSQKSAAASSTVNYQPTDYREEAPARGPEDLGRVVGNVTSAFKLSDDTIGLLFVGGLGIFLLRMFGK